MGKRLTRKGICSICECEYDRWGNNAEPVNDGRCCDFCNWAVVIPARAREYEAVKAAAH
jgi:hypothetical protein